MEVLRVLDAPPRVRFVGMGLERFLVDVQGFAISPIPDGVDTELEFVLDGDFERFS